MDTPPIQQPSASPIHRIRRGLDLEQLKMPLGFVRIVEMLFAIVVLAASSGWEFQLRFACQLDNNKPINRSYVSYGLDIDEIAIAKCDGSNSTSQLFPDVSLGIGPSLYSYLVGATLIFAVITVLLYAFNYAFYVSDNRLPSLDLAITTGLAFGWLFGTLLYSIAVGRIEEATTQENVKSALEKLALCEGVKNECKVIDLVHYAVYSPLSVAVIAGCALVLLFFANIWFCYKETGAFRQARDKMLHQMHQEPYTLE